MALAVEIHERLYTVEAAFVKAAHKGTPALTTFYRDLWEPLANDIQNYEDITEQTLELWDSVASRIAMLSEYLIEVDEGVSTVKEEAHSELDIILSKFDSNASTATSLTPEEQVPDNEQHLCSSHLESAYLWLAHNLHNPYPSKETRHDIAIKTGSKQQTVDSWFVDIRRRIGWNRLRKNRFSNRRADIVDAAKRFFASDDDLDPCLRLEFAAIERKVKDMYDAKFTQGELALDLDAWANQEKIGRARGEEGSPSPTNRALDISQDSSEPSGSRLYPPITKPVQLSLSSEQTAPATGKKRRSSGSESEGETHPRRKRTRASVRSSVPGELALLSSPKSDTPTESSAQTPTPTSSRPSSPCSSGPITPPSQRKRRLSEADEDRSPKRARRGTEDPVLVVDPSFQISDDWNEFENWFTNDLSRTSHDSPQSILDIQFFDCDKWNPLSHLPGHTPDLANDLPLFPDNQLLPSRPGLQLSAPLDGLITTTQTHNIDHLFGELDDLASGNPQKDLPNLQAISTNYDVATQSRAQDPLAIGPSLEPVYEVDWPSQQSSGGYINWSIIPQDYSTPYHPATYLDSQTLLTNTVPVRDISSHVGLEATADKQRRLAEIQEEARRLRAEIAQSCWV